MEGGAVKLCECGCGNPVPMAKWTDKRRGHVKGQPIRFIKHHCHGCAGRLREQNPAWKGGQHKSDRGYTMVLSNDSPHTKYVPLHRLIAEKTIGRPLPLDFPVHHHSETQFVICESDAYHFLLHLRTRAYCGCGHADWWKCLYCKKYDSINNLIVQKTGRTGKKYIQYAHKECHNKYERDRYMKSRFLTRENPVQMVPHV